MTPQLVGLERGGLTGKRIGAYPSRNIEDVAEKCVRRRLDVVAVFTRIRDLSYLSKLRLEVMAIIAIKVIAELAGSQRMKLKSSRSACCHVQTSNPG